MNPPGKYHFKGTPGRDREDVTERGDPRGEPFGISNDGAPMQKVDYESRGPQEDFTKRDTFYQHPMKKVRETEVFAHCMKCGKVIGRSKLVCSGCI